jgi:hypothetical protein
VSDVVLSHGLNHTKYFGEQREDSMLAVHAWLKKQYPMARLYHLEPPTSLQLLAKVGQQRNVSRFCQMMVDSNVSLDIRSCRPDQHLTVTDSITAGRA